MKVLLDTCIAPSARDHLISLGHEVVWAGDWNQDPGDQVLLATAHQEARVLVTLDKDFGELGVLKHLPHRGIIRVVDFPSGDQGKVAAKILATYAEDLQAGAIITAQPGRARIRRS